MYSCVSWGRALRYVRRRKGTKRRRAFQLLRTTTSKKWWTARVHRRHRLRSSCSALGGMWRTMGTLFTMCTEFCTEWVKRRRYHGYWKEHRGSEMAAEEWRQCVEEDVRIAEKVHRETSGEQGAALKYLAMTSSAARTRCGGASRNRSGVLLQLHGRVVWYATQCKRTSTFVTEIKQHVLRPCVKPPVVPSDSCLVLVQQ